MPTTDINETGRWLRLALIPGISPGALRKLLAEFGSPERVLAASGPALRNLVPAEIATAIADGGNAQSAQVALAWLAEPDNHMVTLGDADYPQLLLQTADPPPVALRQGTARPPEPAGARSRRQSQRDRARAPITPQTSRAR